MNICEFCTVRAYRKVSSPEAPHSRPHWALPHPCEDSPSPPPQKIFQTLLQAIKNKNKNKYISLIWSCLSSKSECPGEGGAQGELGGITCVLRKVGQRQGVVEAGKLQAGKFDPRMETRPGPMLSAKEGFQRPLLPPPSSLGGGGTLWWHTQ